MTLSLCRIRKTVSIYEWIACAMNEFVQKRSRESVRATRVKKKISNGYLFSLFSFFHGKSADLIEMNCSFYSFTTVAIDMRHLTSFVFASSPNITWAIAGNRLRMGTEYSSRITEHLTCSPFHCWNVSNLSNFNCSICNVQKWRMFIKFPRNINRIDCFL